MLEELKTFDNILEYLNNDIKSVLSKIPIDYKENLEEIRLRNGSPLNIYLKGQDYFISTKGGVLKEINNSLIINQQHINNTFQLITNHSIYAFTEEIKNGFITIPGGHRVGIGGKVIYNSTEIENIKNISSLNIRIAREKKGISNFLIPYLLDNKGEFYNTLIISPPQCGKTTLLRDMVRNLSNGNGLCKGFKIGLVDERSEIAGVYNGLPQRDVGVRTDILDGCLKYHGIIILIRAMSPNIIAVDEIGGIKDIEAIREGLRAGIKFIATIHGYGIEDIRNRINLSELIKEKIFKRYIVLDRSLGVGTIREIVDGDTFKPIDFKKGVLYGGI